MNTVRLEDRAFVPWSNGGGRTRELLAWPTPEGWNVRVSVAEIEADGPFSQLPGIDRCFAVLAGAGVMLALPGGQVLLTSRNDALAFAGEAGPMCRLIAGPTRDLNLMVRRGAGTARMQRAPLAGRWRGVYADGTLWWSDDPHEPLPALSQRPHAWHLSA